MGSFGVRCIVVASFILSWSVLPSAHASEMPAGIRRIRVLPPCLTTLITDAAALSATLRFLVARIERSDLIVYVRCVAMTNTALAGRLMFMTAILEQRFLMIEVRTPEQWQTQVATVAHELQHAVEIANTSWVRSDQTMALYYRQSGITIADKPLTFDTEAARQVGLRVQREIIAAAPPRPAPGAATARTDR
jgi:hypothetical protein